MLEAVSLFHQPLHSLGGDCVGPVASFFEMGTDDHPICINVAFQVVVGHPRTNQNWDSHRLGNG